MKIQTTTKIQVDEKNGYRIELEHINQDASMTMSGFEESFDEMASDGIRTKHEAEIDKKHIQRLKKDLVEINSRKSSHHGRNAQQSYYKEPSSI